MVGRDSPGPRLELGTRPLEAVVAVTELPRRQPLELHVVLAVRRRQDDRARSRIRTAPARSAEPRRVEVLDHFDDGRRVEPGQPLVTVGERGLEELDPLALSWCEPLEPQPALRDLEDGVGDVHADDLQERRLLQQLAQQLAAAAAEVEHPRRPARAQRGDNRPVPLLVQAHRLLNRLLFGRALLDVVVNRPSSSMSSCSSAARASDRWYFR